MWLATWAARRYCIEELDGVSWMGMSRQKPKLTQCVGGAWWSLPLSAWTKLSIPHKCTEKKAVVAARSTQSALTPPHTGTHEHASKSDIYCLVVGEGSVSRGLR